MAENKALVTIGTNNNLSALVDALIPKMISILPKHLSADRFVKLLLTAAVKDPKILSCTRESVISAMILSAEIGLEINPATGSGAIIPFWNGKKNCLEAQFMPMYRGLQTLATNHPDVISLNAQLVYDKDFFDWGLGDSPFVKHKPYLDDDSGDIKASYSVAWIKGSPVPSIEIMSRKQLAQVKNASQTGRKNSGPWKDWSDEMLRKAVTKRHLKRLPCAIDPILAKAINADNVSSGFVESLAHEVTITEAEPPRGVNALAHKIVSEEPKALPKAEAQESKLKIVKKSKPKKEETTEKPVVQGYTEEERKFKLDSIISIEVELFGTDLKSLPAYRNTFLKQETLDGITDQQIFDYENTLAKRLEEELAKAGKV